MEYALLRSLRTLAPGLIILAYVDLAFYLTHYDEVSFLKMDASKIIFFGYIVGGIYGVTAGGALSKNLFEEVNDAIVRKLTAIAPELNGRTWKDLSPHYYALIDSDKSLGHKGQSIFYNGLIVTTAHSAMWISVPAAAIGALFALSGKGCGMLWISLITVGCSHVLWRRAVKKQIDLIDGQINVIEKRFLRDLVKRVTGG